MTGIKALHTRYLKPSRKQFLKRLLAFGVLLCFVLLTFLAMIIGVTHAGHNCAEKTCVHCVAVKVLKVVAIVLSAVAALLVTFAFTAVSNSHKLSRINLVEANVRMNN